VDITPNLARGIHWPIILIRGRATPLPVFFNSYFERTGCVELARYMLTCAIFVVGGAGHANNRVPFPNSIHQPMVPLFTPSAPGITYGQCSGTIVQATGKIVTAAHCLLGQFRFLLPSDVHVGIAGKILVATAIAIHPLYRAAQEKYWEELKAHLPT